MAYAKKTQMTWRLAARIRKLVYSAAEKHEIPPVCITAHVRSARADLARKEVWQIMILDLNLSRQTVASIFDRDRRRLRKSAIGV